MLMLKKPEQSLEDVINYSDVKFELTDLKRNLDKELIKHLDNILLLIAIEYCDQLVRMNHYFTEKPIYQNRIT